MIIMIWLREREARLIWIHTYVEYHRKISNYWGEDDVRCFELKVE